MQRRKEENMRRRAYISFYDKPDFIDFIYNKIKDEAVEIGTYENGRMIITRIYEDTESYQFLMNEIKKKGIKYSFGEMREYTKNEIKQAKLFKFDTVFPWERDWKTASDFGTKYMIPGVCEHDGEGKIQVSDLMVDIKKLSKYDIADAMPEIMVSEKLYNIIIENGLTGCEFKPVHDYKGRPGPVYNQMVVNSILPKMNDEIRLEIESTYCDKCNRETIYLRSEAIYDGNVLGIAKDFNLTYEFFNMSFNRYTIISAKAHDILKKNKIKSFVSEPVRLV